MKILKEGKIPTETKQFACHNCGTVFEAEKGEYTYADQMAYVHDGVTAYCICPLCGRRTYTCK